MPVPPPSASCLSGPYLPGRTPRPAEGTFAALTATARQGMSVADLAASAAWCGGWRFLDAGYCWEAHELFEPVWMALPQNSRARVFAQGVIQVANAGLKARMGRPAAVTRIAARAHAHLAEAGPEGAAAMGIAPGRAETLLQAARFYMHNSA